MARIKSNAEEATSELASELAVQTEAPAAPATGSENTKTAVVYHVPYAAPRKLFVLKENANGTLDIGGADGKVEVRHCPVAKEPTPGHATRKLEHLAVKGDDKPGDEFPEIK